MAMVSGLHKAVGLILGLWLTDTTESDILGKGPASRSPYLHLRSISPDLVQGKNTECLQTIQDQRENTVGWVPGLQSHMVLSPARTSLSTASWYLSPDP